MSDPEGICENPDCTGTHDHAGGRRYGLSRSTGRPLKGHDMNGKSMTVGRLWDRLSGPEKGGLVRQWRRFTKALSDQTRLVTDSRSLGEASRDALFDEDAAKAKASYLFALHQTWYRLSSYDSAMNDIPRLPDGGDLDGLLWEQHPSNLLDEIVAATLPKETNA